MRHQWNKPSVAKVMDEPCVLVVTRGQLCVIQAALLDAEQAFEGADRDAFPLLEIRSAIARTESVLSPLGEAS